MQPARLALRDALNKKEIEQEYIHDCIDNDPDWLMYGAAAIDVLKLEIESIREAIRILNQYV